MIRSKIALKYLKYGLICRDQGVKWLDSSIENKSDDDCKKACYWFRKARLSTKLGLYILPVCEKTERLRESASYNLGLFDGWYKKLKTTI